MLNLLAVALVDGGVVAFAVGAVSLVRPLRVGAGGWLFERTS